MNIKEHYIKYFKLIPLFLVLISEFVTFLSENIANYFTAASFVVVIAVTICYIKYISKYMIIAFILVVCYIIFVSIGTYSAEASILDGLRYILPFVVLCYGVSFKDDFNFLVKALIIIILINNLYQLISYGIYFIDKNWYYAIGNSTNSINGIIRACGITHSFDFFAFTNLIGFYLSYQFYNKKYAAVFILFLILSFSFKYIILFAVLLIYLGEWKKILTVVILCISVLVLNQNLRDKIISGVQIRYSNFLVDYKSPRPESYRVLKQHIQHNSVFHAEGVGVFGGPASTKYNSEYYDKVSFKWHGRAFATTDTYYPHLFIELGLIQGLIYLALIFLPFIIERKHLKKLSFVVVIFLFSSIFNFSMNNYISLLFSFSLILPLIFYEKSKNSNNPLNHTNEVQ